MELSGDGPPAALLIPVDVGKKKPSVRHIGGRWSRAKSDSWFRTAMRSATFDQDVQLGFLLSNGDSGLAVVDCDTAESYAFMTAALPELAAAPMAHTRRGIHLYVRMTRSANAAGLSDSPLMHPSSGERLNVDFKSITQNTEANARGEPVRTGALVLVPPNQNYRWAKGRSLLEVDPTPLSAAAVTFLLSCRARQQGKKKAARPKKASASTGDAEGEVAPGELRPELVWDLAGGNCARREDGSLRLHPSRDEDISDVQAMFREASSSGFAWGNSWSRGGAMGMSFSYDGTCCLCRAKVHDNCYKFYWDERGVRRLATHSTLFKSCTAPERGERVKFSARSLAAYWARMEAALARIAAPLASGALAAVRKQLRSVLALTQGDLRAAGVSVKAAWYDGAGDALYVRLSGADQGFLIVCPDRTEVGSRSSGTLGGPGALCNVHLTDTPWCNDRAEMSSEELRVRQSDELREIVKEYSSARADGVLSDKMMSFSV